MVKINSSHTDAVEVIGSYFIDAASRTFYKQNKPTGHYLFLNEATGWWTVRKNILFKFLKGLIKFVSHILLMCVIIVSIDHGCIPMY